MVLPRAPTADETLNATVLSRLKNLQATNPALDYGTLEVLTRLTEEEVPRGDLRVPRDPVTKNLKIKID